MGIVGNIMDNRSEKNILISRIINSVTHLQSFSNTAVADILPETPYREPRSIIAVPSTDVATPSTDITALSPYIVASNCECLMMLHDVL